MIAFDVVALVVRDGPEDRLGQALFVCELIEPLIGDTVEGLAEGGSRRPGKDERQRRCYGSRSTG